MAWKFLSRNPEHPLQIRVIEPNTWDSHHFRDFKRHQEQNMAPTKRSRRDDDDDDEDEGVALESASVSRHGTVSTYAASPDSGFIRATAPHVFIPLTL